MADALVRAALAVISLAGFVVALVLPFRHREWFHGRRVSVWLWCLPFGFSAVFWVSVVVVLNVTPLGEPTPVWLPWLSRLPLLGIAVAFVGQLWVIDRTEQVAAALESGLRSSSRNGGRRVGGGERRVGAGTGQS